MQIHSTTRDGGAIDQRVHLHRSPNAPRGLRRLASIVRFYATISQRPPRRRTNTGPDRRRTSSGRSQPCSSAGRGDIIGARLIAEAAKEDLQPDTIYVSQRCTACNLELLLQGMHISGNCSTRLNYRTSCLGTARIAWYASMPQRAAVPMTDRKAANKISSPMGSEAASDLAVCGCGSQFAFAAVVVWRRIRMFEEGKQIAGHFAVTLAQPPTVSAGWCQRQNRIEFVIQPTQISPARAFGQSFASRASTTMRTSKRFIRGAKTVSPVSLANVHSRSWCARQICQRSAWPC